MEIEQLERDYRAYAGEYKALQTEVAEFLRSLRKGTLASIHIHEINQRPHNNIKSLRKIRQNNENPKKYKDLKSLFDIGDIAGVRITCHCEDDLDELDRHVRRELAERYGAVGRKEKGSKTGSDIVEEPYRAIHLYLRKPMKKRAKEVSLGCEVQLRTVLADAWAVQNHKYVYDVSTEGEANDLSVAVAEIMRGCEKLWSIVKKRSIERERRGLSGRRTVEKKETK